MKKYISSLFEIRFNKLLRSYKNVKNLQHKNDNSDFTVKFYSVSLIFYLSILCTATMYS